jgi:hypothetical protein
VGEEFVSIIEIFHGGQDYESILQAQAENID